MSAQKFGPASRNAACRAVSSVPRNRDRLPSPFQRVNHILEVLVGLDSDAQVPTDAG